jgi:hypothetical protein
MQLLYPGFARTSFNQASVMKSVVTFALNMGWKQVPVSSVKASLLVILPAIHGDPECVLMC